MFVNGKYGYGMREDASVAYLAKEIEIEFYRVML